MNIPQRFCFRLLMLTLTCPVVAGARAQAEGLTLNQARAAADAAFAHAASKQWKISVAIVNAEGNLVLFERGDGSYAGSVASAQEKARSANAFQRPTRAFVDAVKDGRTGILSGSNIVAIEGGVPIVWGGAHAGAIGVSGAKAVEDEECANAAVAALAK
jgi:glc operon protein GlcG